jgi:hypothetical protein
MVNSPQMMKVHCKDFWRRKQGKRTVPHKVFSVIGNCINSYCLVSRSNSWELAGMLVVLSEEWGLCYYLLQSLYHSHDSGAITALLCFSQYIHCFYWFWLCPQFYHPSLQSSLPHDSFLLVTSTTSLLPLINMYEVSWEKWWVKIGVVFALMEHTV